MEVIKLFIKYKMEEIGGGLKVFFCGSERFNAWPGILPFMLMVVVPVCILFFILGILGLIPTIIFNMTYEISVIIIRGYAMLAILLVGGSAWYISFIILLWIRENWYRAKMEVRRRKNSE